MNSEMAYSHSGQSFSLALCRLISITRANTSTQGPVAPSMVSDNHCLRSIEIHTFPR